MMSFRRSSLPVTNPPLPMEILLILFLITFNGVFAMSEISIVSSRRIRLQQMADAGDKGAKAALALSAQPTFFLSTVQIGITLIGVMSGALGEGAITDRLQPYFFSIPLLAPYAKLLATLCMVITVTYFSLVIGELVPKRLAMQSPEKVARMVSPFMLGILRLTHPVVRFLSWSTEHILDLLGVRRTSEPPITEEEIKGLMTEGANAGIFEHAERELVTNVFRMDEWNLSLIMTTRPDIRFLDLDDPLPEQIALLVQTSYSYLPVCRDGLANILGVLSLPILLQHTLQGGGLPADIEKLLKPALFAPMGLSPLSLLDLFRKRREHLALVVDEYGEIQGLVTLTDVLEAMVGELPSDSDQHDPDVVKREDGSYLLDGALSIERFRDLYPLECEDLEASRDFQTLAGLILFELGGIPRTGELLIWQRLRLEVVDMDGMRIDKVLVSRPTDTQQP